MNNCTFGGFLDSPQMLSYEEKGAASYFHDLIMEDLPLLWKGDGNSSLFTLSVQHHLLKRQ